MISIGKLTLTLTVPETAKLLGISRGHAYELVARNQLPAIKHGRRRLIPHQSIEAMLQQGRSAT